MSVTKLDAMFADGQGEGTVETSVKSAKQPVLSTEEPWQPGLRDRTLAGRLRIWWLGLVRWFRESDPDTAGLGWRATFDLTHDLGCAGPGDRCACGREIAASLLSSQ